MLNFANLPARALGLLVAGLSALGACSSATSGVVAAVDDAGQGEASDAPDGDISSSEGGTSLETDAGSKRDAGKGDAGKRSDAGQPADAGAFAGDSGGAGDAAASCWGKPFALAVTVPMPSSYRLAGFEASSGFASGRKLVFFAEGTPRHIFSHRALDIESGNLTVDTDESIFQPEETVYALATSREDSEVTWRLVKFIGSDGGTYYRVRADSDANLSDYTFNLTGITAESVMTSSYMPAANNSGKWSYYFARNGQEVQRGDWAHGTWSMVASLNGSGTTNWQGLAIAADPIAGLRVFLRASITGGGSGLIEQRWPNALAASAEPPILVFSGGDAIPFGVAEDGCALYASHLNAGILEVLIYRR